MGNIDTHGRTMINLDEVQGWISSLEEGETLGIWYDGKQFYQDDINDDCHWICDIEKNDELGFLCDVTNSIMSDIEADLF